MFSALSEEECERGPPPLTDSESEKDESKAELDSDSEEWLEGVSRWLEEASCRNNRWSRWRKVVAKRRSHRKAAEVPTAASSPSAEVVGGTSCAENACSPRVMDSARSLIEISMNSLNGLSEETEEWEEIEFMVDSGAGTTVIGPEHAKAVQASEPHPNANYKLADGSIIHNQGRKTFTAVTEEWDLRKIGVAVTKVDTPLLSVSSCVMAGATVVFSPKGSCIDTPGGNRVPLTASKGVYNLKMWVPRNQKNPFQGQA